MIANVFSNLLAYILLTLSYRISSANSGHTSHIDFIFKNVSSFLGSTNQK